MWRHLPSPRSFCQPHDVTYVVEALIVFCVITPSSAAVLLVNIHHLFKSCLSSLEAVIYCWTSSITYSITTLSRAASRTWMRSCPGKQCPASSWTYCDWSGFLEVILQVLACRHSLGLNAAAYIFLATSSAGKYILYFQLPEPSGTLQNNFSKNILQA